EAAGWLYAFANTLACIAPAALCLVATRIELHALADPSSAGLGFLADHFDQTQTQFLVARAWPFNPVTHRQAQQSSSCRGQNRQLTGCAIHLIGVDQLNLMGLLGVFVLEANPGIH